MAQFPIRPPPRRADSEHEGKCRRCGISCHLALPVRGTPVVIPGLRCKFLVARPAQTWACSVYETRFELAPWCHHADDAAPLGFLARDCAYALEHGGGLGKVRLREPLLTRVWPQLLAGVREQGVPLHASGDAFLVEVARREGQPYRLEPWPEHPDRLRLVPVGEDRT